MTGVLWLIEAILLGCLLVYRWVDLRAIDSFPSRVLLIFGAGAAAGIGLTSVLFFLAGVLLGNPAVALALELAALAWCAYDAIRRRATRPAYGETWNWVTFLLAASLLIALAAATTAAMSAWAEIPHGNWDAWSIWNLRARYLAAGSGLSSRAWSPLLAGFTHADYPLLIPAFVARCWSFSHSTSMAVPAGTSYVFTLALISLVSGGITAVRGAAPGLAAGLILACTPALVREVPAQYADLPLACYMAGALVFVLLERPWVAGVFGGFAAWTKDEGVLFIAVLLLATAFLKRKTLLSLASGALPAAILALLFKATLPKGATSLLGSSLPGAMQRALDFSRYTTVLRAFGTEFAGLGTGWYHPVLPLVILAFAFGFDRKRRDDVRFCGVTAGALLLGYFSIYIVTSNDLTWQLQTSLARLLVQAWPLLVITAFAGMAVWQTVPAASLPPQKTSRKAARRAR